MVTAMDPAFWEMLAAGYAVPIPTTNGIERCVSGVDGAERSVNHAYCQHGGAGPNVILVDAPIDITGPAAYVHKDADLDKPWPRCQAILYPPTPPDAFMADYFTAGGVGHYVRTTKPVNCPLCLNGAVITEVDGVFRITRGGESVD